MRFLFKKTRILLIVSSVVFIFLNILENLIQFTIGRNPGSEKIIDIVKPTKKDWIKIIIVTLIFALLQGILTSFFNAVFHSNKF